MTPRKKAAPAPAAGAWTHETGVAPYRVTTFELVEREHRVCHRWWRLGKRVRRMAKGPDGRPFTVRVDDVPGGALDAAKVAQAITDAAHVFAVVSANGGEYPTTPRLEVTRALLLTLGETKALLVDPDTGRFPKGMGGKGQKGTGASAHAKESGRALEFAIQVLGADARWVDIGRDAITKLIRRRLRQLLASGRVGVRATQITIGRLLEIAEWLRQGKHIPYEAVRLSRKWREDVMKEWRRETQSTRDAVVNRPRYTKDELRRIDAKAPLVDPRFALLVTLGAPLRLGQVIRLVRPDVRLEASDHGEYTVYGSGHKGGQVVEMTAGERAVLDAALHPETGYLRALEAAYQAGTITSYPIFPGHSLRGSRRGTKRSAAAGHARVAPESWYAAVRAAGFRPASKKWVSTAWKKAEALAGVTPVRGRGPYGGRRRFTDAAVEQQISRHGLQAMGGHSSTQTPDNIYRDQENKLGRKEARDARAIERGEDLPPTTTTAGEGTT